jgi:hypothetical protein
MKRLILDRGFLDGPSIGHCKKDLGIEVLIPARKDLDIYQDVVDLAEGGLLSVQAVSTPEAPPALVPVHRPERIRKREAARKRTLAAAQNRKVRGPAAAPPLRSEVAAVADLETFTTCPIPIHAVVNREIHDDGHSEYWVLLDTAPDCRSAPNTPRLQPAHEHRSTTSSAEVLLRSREILLAGLSLGGQSGGLRPADVQPSAMVLATHRPPGTPFPNASPCFGAVATHVDGDFDLLPKLTSRGSLRSNTRNCY